MNSKIVSQYSTLLAPIAVDAVMRVITPATAENVDLNDIRIVKKVGGTIDDTELVEGLVLNQPVIKNAGGPTRMEKAKIGLIQFQLSPPKPDVPSFPPNTTLPLLFWLLYFDLVADASVVDGESDCCK